MMDLSPLWTTFKISLAATVFVFVTGLLLAWVVTNLKRGRAVIDAVLSLPLVLPPTVMGFLILICVGANSAVGKFLDSFGMRLVFTWQGAAIAAAVVSFPVMYRGIRGALEQVNPAVIQAGRTLGLGEFKILRKVMLPMAAPGILASVVLSFARCLGEFGATLMVAGNIPGETRTMSIAVYTAMQGGDRELAYKWVAIIVAYSLIILVGLNCLPSLRRSRR
jgi:molybdate transport system permease protein